MNKDLENQIAELEKQIATMSGATYEYVFFVACGGFYRPLPSKYEVIEWLGDCGMNVIDPLIHYDFRPEITFPRLWIPDDNPPNAEWYQVRMPGSIHNHCKESLDWCHPMLNRRYEEWKQQRIVDN